MLFDQPHVLDKLDASDRLQLRPGDFFQRDLPVCDLYLLMEVIHDWDDDRAGLILGNIHAAAQPAARVLMIEALIPDGSEPSWPLTLDLWMLSLSGKQRSLAEYMSLLEASGFRYIRRIDTPAGVTIVEAIAV